LIIFYFFFLQRHPEDLLADEERAANTATDSGDYRAQTKRSRILGANHEEQIIATQLETK
jgi:hypothetical protein